MTKTYIYAAAIALLLAPQSHAQVWVNPQFDTQNRYNKPLSPVPGYKTQQSAYQTTQSANTARPAPTYAPIQQPARVIKPVPVVAVPKIESTAPAVTATQPSDPGKTIWSGRVNFGASLQTGNTEKNAILGDASLKAKIDEKNRATIKAEYNREKDDGDVTEDNRSLDGTYEYLFKPKWFAQASAGLEQDDIAELDLRTTLGAGLGYQAYERDDLNLKMVAGPTYLRSEFENGSTDSSIAARWALDYDQKVLEDRFQLFHDHEIFIPGDDTGAFLLESKSGVRVPITKGIIGTGEIDFDWDNDPEPGITEDDTKYAVKLGYEW
ncbi:DUF481 domain-containing protein [Alphaproteobacteria bacterium]|nr:DUF481 domain-containing protein [Alphaproteobacteria bacterium]